MRAYLQQEEAKLRQQYLNDQNRLRSVCNEDIAEISRLRHVDIYRNQIFYHMTALRVAACVLACFVASWFASPNTEFGSFLLWAAILIGLAMLALNWARDEKRKDARNNVEVLIARREAKLNQDLEELDKRHAREMQQLQHDVRNRVKVLGRHFCTSTYTSLLVDWLLNELKQEIDKANRSPYYPNVLARLNFQVTRGSILVPGRPSYDMAAQSIRLPDDPIAPSVLAKVLSDNVQSRGSKRFRIDPAGGPATIRSNWAEGTGVWVEYNAVNGNVGK